MTATATETLFNREPERILAQVERGEAVFIEKHGSPCAVMIPHPQRTSGAQLAQRLRLLKPAPAAAAAVAELIEGMNHAGRTPWHPA